MLISIRYPAHNEKIWISFTGKYKKETLVLTKVDF